MRNALEWPDKLDALIAASEYHHLLFENEAVRVLDIRVPPGHTVPLHTHCWPSVLYLLSWSDCVRRDDQGTVVMDSRAAMPRTIGAAFWSPAMRPHTLENVGISGLHVIGVELKMPD